jgi:large conductance mechanosensitive channel
MLKEFKEFAIKGSVTDMAVGIIVGAAFTTVVKSLVDELIMPLLSLLTGGLDFADKFAVLRPGPTTGPYTTLAEARAGGATVLAYGSFINSVVAFLIVALVLFFVIRWMNRLRRPDTPPAPNTKACPFCKSAIDRNASRCPYCTSEQAADSGS